MLAAAWHLLRNLLEDIASPLRRSDPPDDEDAQDDDLLDATFDDDGMDATGL